LVSEATDTPQGGLAYLPDDESTNMI
jgi:hypothetical protein